MSRDKGSSLSCGVAVSDSYSRSSMPSSFPCQPCKLDKVCLPSTLGQELRQVVPELSRLGCFQGGSRFIEWCEDDENTADKVKLVDIAEEVEAFSKVMMCLGL